MTKFISIKNRRNFLKFTALLGSVISTASIHRAFGDAFPESNAITESKGTTSAEELEHIRSIIESLTLDTMKGLVAFVAPGDDEYSNHQSVFLSEKGGVAANSQQFVIGMLNSLIPLPGTQVLELLIRVIMQWRENVTNIPNSVDVDADGKAYEVLEFLAAHIDAISQLENLPAAPLVAMMMNTLAVDVDRKSLKGSFISTFSNLSWEDKGEVFGKLEETFDRDTFKNAIKRPNENSNERATQRSDGHSNENADGSADGRFNTNLSLFDGLFETVAGGSLQLGAMGAYNEFDTFSPSTRQLTALPVGWALTNYQEGRTVPVEGWDSFLGYYGDRREVDDA